MTNAERAEIGAKTFKAFCKAANVKGIEMEQDYSVTDAIANLLHYAKSKGFDADTIVSSAVNHFECETQGIDCCPECGGDDCDCE
jgi:hypothetical protein